MKVFEEPMFEVVKFSTEDIIVTSSCWDNTLFSSETCGTGSTQFTDRD